MLRLMDDGSHHKFYADFCQMLHVIVKLIIVVMMMVMIMTAMILGPQRQEEG
jgi:hypothetical protein